LWSVVTTAATKTIDNSNNSSSIVRVLLVKEDRMPENIARVQQALGSVLGDF
jgi:hypothetical protein